MMLLTQLLARGRDYILRIPKEGALLPYQILNEVGFHNFVTTHLHQIPVPAVHGFRAGEEGAGEQNSFIVEDPVAGQILCEFWGGYTKLQKLLSRGRLPDHCSSGETTFEKIGGLMPDGAQGPNVEWTKLCKGRVSYDNPSM